MYISETANPSSRGGLNIMFQLATTMGILIASGINYGKQAAQSNVTRYTSTEKLLCPLLD